MELLFIQKYLDHQFIRIGDETEIEYVKKSIEEVKGILQKSTATLVSGTLIAFDPGIREDALIEKINAIILANWSLFRNKNKNERAITIIRAVILEAISQLAKEDLERLAVIWLTAKNVYTHSSLGREDKLFKPWLEDLGNAYLVKAYSEWGLPKLQRNTIRTDKISKQVEKLIAENFSATDKLNAAPNSPEWRKEFIAALTSTFSAILAKQFGVKELDEAQNSLNQRNQLLWLKESRYSFSTNKRHKEISPSAFPIVIASDISNLTTRFIPPSVYTFLESIFSQVDPSETKIALKDFFDEFVKDTTTKALVNAEVELNSKCNLLQFLTHLKNDKSMAKHCERYTGLKPTTQLTLSHIAVLLLNDFLSIKPHDEV